MLRLPAFLAETPFKQQSASAERCVQVYMTLEEADANRGNKKQLDTGDGPLRSLVLRTLAGQHSGEEQARVAFDRALATSGAKGFMQARLLSHVLKPVC